MAKTLGILVLSVALVTTLSVCYTLHVKKRAERRERSWRSQFARYQALWGIEHTLPNFDGNHIDYPFVRANGKKYHCSSCTKEN